MIEQLKQQVWQANMELPAYGLVTYTWGNVSAIDRQRRYVVIKPSGVDYATMTVDDMVVIDLEGNILEGNYRPSSDTPTHLELYRRFTDIGAIVHTHSTHATAWAQAGTSIPPLGTTHADYFLGEIPCTAPLSEMQVNQDYETQTGVVIAETIKHHPLYTPGVIVYQHGPFTWGKDAAQAVHNAVVLEEVAKIAWITCGINRHVPPIDDYLMQKHFNRKHGANAYYGQPTEQRD